MRNHLRLHAPLLAGAFLATGLLSPRHALPAQGPTRTYSKPAAELSEPYSSLRGVRELSDGRVVVTDPRDKVVHLVDLKANRATPIGREGSGPNEFQLPMSAFALPGDSTMVVDALNSRFFLLGPGGTVAGTWSPAANAPAGGQRAPAASPRSGGGRTMIMAGGPGGPMALLSVRATDALGRVYMEGSAVAMGPDGPRAADSIPLLRTTRTMTTTDTVAWLQRKPATVSSSGGGMSIRIGGDPFPSQDGWSVLPDGRVAVVRASDYHVEVYPASGRGPAARGAAVKTPAIRVTEAEKQAWRDTRGSSGGMAFAVTQTSGSGGTTRSVAPSARELPDPDEWPATLPAFQANQVYAVPNGQVWVGRYQAASDKAPRFDVFDATGRPAGQVAFPPRTRIVGFGKGSVYTVRIDEDDLQYLQRYTLQ